MMKEGIVGDNENDEEETNNDNDCDEQYNDYDHLG